MAAIPVTVQITVFGQMKNNPVNTYHIYFLGRRSGAIGTHYQCRVIINAASAGDAMKHFRLHFGG